MIGVVNRPRPPLALAYHGVARVPVRKDRGFLFVRPEDLKRQIGTLRRWGYRLVTFGELARLAGEGDAASSAALTFDDGLADNLHALVPLLRDAGAPATVFAVSGWLGGTHPDAPWAPILTAAELRELHAAGIEVGCHTASHPNLAALGYENARDELERGRHELEEVIGAPVKVAAYPFGAATEDTITAARDAGFAAAARTAGRGSWGDPLNLPRQSMGPTSTRAGLWLKRDDRYERLVARLPGRAARAVVHRVKRLVR
jgi:peptidoglycan/xylan/chitin deacetylase (PgdA/CDA1 family)